MKNPKKILVVGRGTAGYIAALILKHRFKQKQIDILGSSDIGIVGVGEGSTEHWLSFMEFVGINQYELIKEADATYKTGIMFRGWTDKDYLHSIQFPHSSIIGQYRYIYGKLIGEGCDSSALSSPDVWQNLIDAECLNNSKKYPTNQFHFNTNKLNLFLQKKSIEEGISVIDDEILDVEIDQLGDITSLKGKKQNYNYDFYIDSTGFKKLLISKFDTEWISFKKYLKMNSAIAFPTEDTENYNMWTLSKAMDYGWVFRIPVWGRGGNGYIFNDEFVNTDNIVLEVEKYLGHPIKISKEFKFDPGFIKTPWVNNCCAVGLSSSFVEPLEATSIGTSIQQMFLLIHRIANYSDYSIKSYNRDFQDIMYNIRDFIFLHYMTDKQNSKFWKEISVLEPPDSLKEKLDMWKYRLPIREDFNKESNYSLFQDAHYIMILQGIGFFDKTAINLEYQNLSDSLKQNADQILKNYKIYLEKSFPIPHKKFIELIRNKF